MKKPEKNSTSKTIKVEYTERDVKQLRERGVVSEDELPNVGIHEFRRSGFVTERGDQKIKISIYLDADILDFFRELAAAKPDAAPFQTQINDGLRAVMEKKRQTPDEFVSLSMLENPKFLSTLAEKLKNAA